MVIRVNHLIFFPVMVRTVCTTFRLQTTSAQTDQCCSCKKVKTQSVNTAYRVNVEVCFVFLFIWVHSFNGLDVLLIGLVEMRERYNNGCTCTVKGKEEHMALVAVPLFRLVDSQVYIVPI